MLFIEKANQTAMWYHLTHSQNMYIKSLQTILLEDWQEKVNTLALFSIGAWWYHAMEDDMELRPYKDKISYISNAIPQRHNLQEIKIEKDIVHCNSIYDS